MSSSKRLLYVVSEEGYFFSHRLILARKAKAQGFKVAVAVKNPTDRLKDEGFEVFSLPVFSRDSLSVFQLVSLARGLRKIYLSFNPHVVHHVSLKLSLVGSIAARLSGVPRIINTLGGMGHLFTHDPQEGDVKKKKKLFLQKIILKALNGLNLSPQIHFIVQNSHDRSFFTRYVHLIQGSGVCTEKYKVMPFPKGPPIVVTFLARLLKEKGILEFIEAARHLQSSSFIFQAYGEIDPENPSSLTLQDIQDYKEYVCWKGFCHNVSEVYSQSHIVVLPSHREGMPKSLLEASSCGRPIITTDAPGCSEAVDHGYTGLVIPVGNPMALAEAIGTLAQNFEGIEKMGKAGRKKVEDFFSNKIIDAQVLELYR